MDKELSEQATQNIRRVSRASPKKREYLLKGEIMCGCCNHSLRRVETKAAYYTCQFSRPDETLQCHGLKIDAVQLERAVTGTLKKQADLFDFREEDDFPVDKASVVSKDYEAQIAQLQEQKMRLYEQYISSEISLADYRTEKASIDKSLIKINSARAAIEVQAKQEKTLHDEQTQCMGIVQELRETDELTSDLVDRLIEKVYVFPDNQLRVEFKLKDIFEDLI